MLETFGATMTLAVPVVVAPSLSVTVRVGAVACEEAGARLAATPPPVLAWEGARVSATVAVLAQRVLARREYKHKRRRADEGEINF